MTNAIGQAQALGHSVWIDYLKRDMLESGELKGLIQQGVAGLTSNPTIFEKALADSTSYDTALFSLIGVPIGTLQIYELLAMEDIREAADMLRPVYERTEGKDGFVSLEVNPSLAYKAEPTIAEAERLFNAINRPNLLIKVPSTAEGVQAIRALIARGINVNATLIFSRERYGEVAEAYIAGLEERAKRGGDISRVASVASFFVSRVDTAVDNRLQMLIQGGKAEMKSLLGKVAVANAKLAYQDFKKIFQTSRFESLRKKGARVQRPVWASTSTKNPAYPDLLYVEPLIGPDTANTMPPATLQAFLDHGKAASTLEEGVAGAEKTLESLAKSGIDIKEITGQLLTEGVKSFADSFDKLLHNLEEKLGRLRKQSLAVRPSA